MSELKPPKETQPTNDDCMDMIRAYIKIYQSLFNTYQIQLPKLVTDLQDLELPNVWEVSTKNTLTDVWTVDEDKNYIKVGIHESKVLKE